MRQQLLKTEGYYLADNQREMHKADAELFFVIDEKQNQIELTEKGIEYLVRNMEDEHFFTLPGPRDRAGGHRQRRRQR